MIEKAADRYGRGIAGLERGVWSPDTTAGSRTWAGTQCIACVRGGEPKIGKDGSLRKWRQRHVDGGTCAQRLEPRRSERLHHRKDYDADHENGRYLIENPIELLRMAIAISGEFAHAAHKETMQSGERDNQHQLGM